MTKKEFDKYLDDLGMNYTKFANELGLHPQTITVWNRNENYPKYFKTALECYKKIFNYKKTIPNGINNENLETINNKISIIEKENKILEEKLKYLESLKAIIKEKLSK